MVEIPSDSLLENTFVAITPIVLNTPDMPPNFSTKLSTPPSTFSILFKNEINHSSSNNF
jgi:hypothetical protein